MKQWSAESSSKTMEINIWKISLMTTDYILSDVYSTKAAEYIWICLAVGGEFNNNKLWVK